MSLLNILVLGIVQGLAELLPVSSSAHVVVTEKLLGLDPSSPPATLLLVMLHTGTMFAVIAYFWRSWRASYFQSAAAFKQFVALIVIATVLTGIIGEGATLLMEHTVLRSVPHAQIEDLFDHLELIAPALAAVGVLIIIAGLRERRSAQSDVPPAPLATAVHSTGAVALAATPQPATAHVTAGEVSAREAGIIGAIQGLTLPFRGFSRSGATISAGMLLGVAKARAEAFSFALAVVLTPLAVGREVWRLMRTVTPGNTVVGGQSVGLVAAHTLLGALVAFLAGLAALRWLSGWLERGRWHLFGIYCLIAAVVVGVLHYHLGY
jgi:undecaprenyl-diphosphatase